MQLSLIIFIQQLNSLHARTGIEVAMFAVRSNSDHYNPAEVFYTSDRIADFFQLSVGHTVQDIATRMEAYCISGVEGLCSQS
jgi:hypothetical protein